MKNTTILFVLHLPPPVHGAAMVGKYIQESELINKRFNCHYINLATASNLEDIGRSGAKKIWRFLELLFRIRKALKRQKPALVYVTPNAKGWAFYKDFIVVMMIKRLGGKVVAHYHNKGVSVNQCRLLDNYLYKSFFKGVRIILLSEKLYDDIQKYVPREDVFICPNGIPISVEKKSLTNKQNRDAIHILFLSNLIVSKGILTLLDALVILKRNGFSFVCDVVGGETFEIDKLRFDSEVVKRDLNRFVVYHGKKYGAEKNAFWELADIFCFPTYYPNECFPLVLLEAMQHCLPVVTTDEGAIPDIMCNNENGFICEKHKPDDFANKLMRLIDDEELRLRMGRNGYQRYLNNYTISAFEERLSGILLSLV